MISRGSKVPAHSLPAPCRHQWFPLHRRPAGRPTALFFCGLALFVLLLSAGCRDPERSGPAAAPHILFISVDTLRSDHLGCYGYGRPTSPAIDALAARGTVFDDVVSCCSWTLPAHASMLTGRYPAHHGLEDDGVRLADGIPTLAELLRRQGYHTAAVVSHLYVSSEFGLDRGFERFDDSLIDGGARNPVAGEVVDRALGLLTEAPPGPWFLFVHFFDPHWNYSPPPPFAARFTDPGYAGPVDGTLVSLEPFMSPAVSMPQPEMNQLIGLYDGEIAYLDEELGRLLGWLDARGLLAETVTVFTADHGEEFKEHGRLGHAKTLFREQLHVPLIIAGSPAFPPGARRAEPVSPVDILPTLLELAGAPPPDPLPGISLAGGSGLPAERSLFSESIRFGNEMRAVRQGPFKAIHLAQGDSTWFFDLGQDPGEGSPLADDPSGGALTSALAEYAAEADSGWHLKIFSLAAQPLRCRALIRTAGRVVRPRRYFSGHLEDRTRASFVDFTVGPDGRTLSFELELVGLIGEVAFATEPADAPVTFRITVAGGDGAAGVFLGLGEAPLADGAFTLDPGDPRLAGRPADYRRARSGCYIRSVPEPVAGEAVELSGDAVRRLEALGYLEKDR